MNGPSQHRLLLVIIVTFIPCLAKSLHVLLTRSLVDRGAQRRAGVDGRRNRYAAADFFARESKGHENLLEQAKVDHMRAR
jgi:hypothetical protein